MTLFHSAKDLVNYLQVKKELPFTNEGNLWIYSMNQNIEFIFDVAKNTFCIKENGTKIKAERDTIMDLTKPENHSVVMLLILILERGYAFPSITLEKKWQTG